MKSILNISQIRITKTFLTTMSCLLFTLFTVSQNVWTVDNRPESGAQYTSVNDAINDDINVMAGDILYIHPSPTSYGNITLDKPFTLIGPGHDPSNSGGIRATLGTITLGDNTFPDVSGTVISGLNISSITAYSFGTQTNDIHIINNRITSTVYGYFNGSGSANWIIEGNYFDSAASTKNIDLRYNDNWQIRNNVFEGQISDLDHTSVVTNNLFINADASGTATIFTAVSGITSPIITNNMFIFTDADVTGLISSGATAITYVNCLAWNAGEGVASDLVALSGSGNLDNTDPIFTSIPTSYTDFYNNDFTLQGGSPAIGAATDTGDIGVFGRGFPFDIHGRPHSMSYPTEMTILNTVVQPGQNLNVTFKASQKN